MNTLFSVTWKVVGVVFIMVACTITARRTTYPQRWHVGEIQLNVFDAPLQTCSLLPKTGFYRTGNCTTSVEDRGAHVMCVRTTWKFLNYSKATGNDLITPSPEFQFPGLVEGDSWCVCADRWKDAMRAGKAAPVFLPGTHQRALDYVSLEELESFSSLTTTRPSCDMSTGECPSSILKSSAS